METTKYKAKYFSDKLELNNLLNQIDKATLDKIGHDMKLISESEYRWADIAEKYNKLFKK